MINKMIKSNIKKTIAVLMPLLIMVFGNFAFAANDINIWWFTQMLQIVGDAVYVILLPLLVITGYALGNDLALWSVFGLDEVLYKFWLLMRNFASIGLVVIILYEIVMWLWKSKINDVVKRIPRYIIVWVLIPASWYFVPFMLSVSNILIMAIGDLPTNVAQNITEKSTKKKSLTTHMYFNLVDKIQSQDFTSRYVYYGNVTDAGKAEYYTKCKFESPEWSSLDYGAIYLSSITSEADRFAKNNKVTISKDYCAINNTTLMALNGYMTDECQPLSITNVDTSTTTTNTIPAVDPKKCFKIYEKWKSQPNFQSAIDKWYAHIWSGNASIDDVWNSTSVVWPLYTIYSSMLNFTSISVSSNMADSNLQFMEMLLKVFVSVMLIMPLIWLCIIAMVRVWIIWLIMAFSPFIVLVNVLYGWGAKWPDGKDGMQEANKFWWKWRIAQMNWDISEIIKLILQPVVIIFGIGLSLVFLQTINHKLSEDISFGSILWMEMNKIDNETQQFVTPMTTINIKTDGSVPGDSIWFNIFQWLLMNIFGIVIMRQIWIMSMKFGKITEKLSDGITKFGKDFVKSRPIIPFPWKDGKWVDFVSIGWLQQWISQKAWLIKDKRFPKDKTYDKLIKPNIDDQKARFSDDWKNANNAIVSQTNSNLANGHGYVAWQTNAQKTENMNKFVGMVNSSNIWGNETTKAGDIAKAEGVQYAAQKMLWSNVENIFKDTHNAEAFFDNLWANSLQKFGKFRTGNSIDESLITGLSKRSVGSTTDGTTKYYHQKAPDGVNRILGYLSKEKKFEEFISLPKAEKYTNSGGFTWLNLPDLDNISNARNANIDFGKIYGAGFSVADEYILKWDNNITEIFKWNRDEKKYIKQ